MTTIIKDIEENILINRNKIAFTFLNEDLSINKMLSFNDLYLRTKLLSTCIPVSEVPVLLLFDSVSEFIISFLACQDAGLTAIPMFFPKSKRHFQRLKDIINDSKCQFVLCEEDNKEKIKNGLDLLGTNTIKIISITNTMQPIVSKIRTVDNPIAFIQYTSGSTSSPKGVVISHENLRDNIKLIKEEFGCDQDSIILSWLPFYHDMGLIGNILQSISSGSTCILMSSLSVIQSPYLWLKAISDFNVTHSGGPNFIYDLCVNQIDENRIKDLNLSSLQVAYNGSEPIKKSTIDAFIQKFQKAGFTPSSYYTCYGLAEATLLISCGRYVEQTSEFTSSGEICKSVEVCIYDTNMNQIIQENGEILIYGNSVTSGYLNIDNSDLFVEISNKKFLRTGDIGSIVNNELIVTGRSKEMIIINGKNFFPYEIENNLSKSVFSIDENGVIVSFIEDENQEKPIVFAEIKKSELKELNPSHIFNQIDRLIIELLGVETIDIVLFTPRKLARTSSGKLQRVKTKENYLVGDVDFLFSKKSENSEIAFEINKWIKPILEQYDYEKVKDYLIIVLNKKLKTTLTLESFNQNLLEIGIDSLKSVDLVNTINDDLNLNIDIIKLMNLTTTVDFEEFIKNLIWMKTTESSGETIFI